MAVNHLESAWHASHLEQCPAEREEDEMTTKAQLQNQRNIKHQAL
jgi:hypothetical protein